MCWDEVRKSYPDRWLVIEAIDAKTEGKKRVIDKIAVVEVFTESIEALKMYIQLHRAEPIREMYVVHTSRNELDIEEIYWAGVRPK